MSGKRLAGRYELQSRVGGGGMAIVYKGHDLLLDRTVAIKVLRSQFGNDEDFIRRFRREAQAAARLTHPNVVSIFDVGQEEDLHYIVMEYVEGENLKDLIKRDAPLPIERAVNITMEIADALEHAHKNQIIHRDIKPHNILIGKDGRVKVTDFGIARAISSATITQTGSVLGSVHYFSPEQAKGGLTGEKSDIYSLGVVLYEMVTGFLPFSGESPISVALKHLQEDFKDPREINPNLPQSVENIILKALNKDPEKRYNSAHDMMVDLKTCLQPERLHEARYLDDSEDLGDEPTIIIPAIRENLQESSFSHDEEEEVIYDDWEEPREPKFRKWIGPIVWLMIIGALVGAGFYMVNLIKENIRVPEVSVPYVENMPVDEAKALLAEKGLRAADPEERFDSEVEEGNVIRQEPKSGLSVKKNTIVNLIVSLGPETVTLPDVTGHHIRDAEAKLRDFKVTVEEEYNDDIPPGNVIRQEPAGDTKAIPFETEVLLVISKGGETFEMPSLLGKTIDQVKSILLKNNLVFDEKNTKHVDSYLEKGLVVSQWPIAPGELVSPGTEISVEISSGLKDDAIRVADYIWVTLTDPETSVDVVIMVSDAGRHEETVISETITQSKEFEIEIIVSPTHNATITVFKNGVLFTTKHVTYDEVMDVIGEWD